MKDLYTVFPGLVCLFSSSQILYVDQSWEYINHSQTHEGGNWDRGCTIPRKGMQKRDFCCSATRPDRRPQDCFKFSVLHPLLSLNYQFSNLWSTRFFNLFSPVEVRGSELKLGRRQVGQLQNSSCGDVSSPRV